MALEAITPLFGVGGALGPPELIIILLIFVLLFGANKIPKLARSTGEAMGEFQKGRQEVEDELESMKDEATEAAGVEDVGGSEDVVDTEAEPVSDTSSTGTEE